MEFIYIPSSQSLRAIDLALNSTFNGRNSKPDYLLDRSITNVAYFYENGKKNRVSLLCTFYLTNMKSLSAFTFYQKN